MIVRFFDQLKELQARTPHYHALGDAKSINCDYADDVWECKNCYMSRSMYLCEDLHYSYRNIRVKSSLDITCSFDLDQCQGCEECFGCVGLFKRKYCILNKQYSESDYRTMRDRIIKKMKERGEYGRFFPPSMVYNGYNASLAALYFPDETRTSIEARGGKWEEPPKSSVSGIVSDQLPDNIADVGDDIVGKVIECAKTGRSFNIIKQEFAFYKKHGIPLPRYYPDGRNWRRYHYVLAANPRTIACYTCKTFFTTYYPEAWGYEKIACQKCYAAQVL